MRRLLNQLAHAAVKNKGSYFQTVFNRLMPRLGYKKAVWAIAHRMCRLIWKLLHEGLRYFELGVLSNPIASKRRRNKLVAELRKLGYQVELTSLQAESSS
jgi:transposase